MGSSRPYKKGRVLPTRNVSLNAFGNVRNHRNIISSFRNKKNHFINSTGIFQRQKDGRAKALYIFEKRAVNIKRLFRFLKLVKRSQKIFNFFFFKRTCKKILTKQKSY